MELHNPSFWPAAVCCLEVNRCTDQVRGQGSEQRARQIGISHMEIIWLHRVDLSLLVSEAIDGRQRIKSVGS